MDNNKPHVEKHHHHILSDATALSIGGALLVLTIVTVAVAHVDLGRLNFVIAMLVASVKALLVALFFMNLRYDRRENGVIFGTSFLFLAIFIVLTGTDLFFRGDVAVKGPLVAAVQTKSKLSKPWISTPELVAHGKELFAQQCVSCHGPEGKGNGPAAGALNPPPRNFTSEAAWKNGRKPSQIFKTLKDGLPPSAMASYATLPSDDRWALVHFVDSLGPTPPVDTPADLAKVGIDVTKAGGGEAQEAPTISVDAAMKIMGRPDVQIQPAGTAVAPEANHGAKLFAERCASCHGAQAQGGVDVKTLGVNPRAFLTTRPLSAQAEGMKSLDVFRKVVVNGLPGDAMPGSGNLSGTEIQELYQYIHTLAGR